MTRFFLCAAIASHLLAQTPPAPNQPAPNPSALHPTVQKIVSEVSQDRIAATMKKLESFGTRHINSAADDPTTGIGAAQRWIASELRGYSPKLQIAEQPFSVRGGGNAVRAVNLANVVALLPGSTDPQHFVLVTAHYDSINIVPGDNAATAAQKLAPGVNDDASGVAAIMELARVMSTHQFRKSVMFIAFSAEEGLHEGSKAFAATARGIGMQIEAVLNDDIVGGDSSGNGRSANGVVRIFAAGPEDSGHRALVRYSKEIAERYVPSMEVEMVFRLDRFSRGGDHMSFVDQGYTAVRWSTPTENYANQHSATDTFANASAPYTTRVARMNAAVASSLALAPRPPAAGRLLTRGDSGYDAVLRWEHSDEPDLAGYSLVIRATTSPVWQREIWVGNVNTFTLSDFSIDNVVLGVKAIGRDGAASLVSAYIEPPYVGSAGRQVTPP